MSKRITSRDDAGLEKYGDSAFVPTGLLYGINRILRVYPSITISADISAHTKADIWADEEQVIEQFRELENTTRFDNAVINELEELIKEQRDSKEETGFYFVFMNPERPQDVSHFRKLGFGIREDY